MGDMEATPMATVIKAMVMAAATATEATRAMVVATGVTRAMAETKATVATKATEEIGDMASSLMAATKDMEGNRAVTITRATAREGMQRTSTAGKPPDTPHDSSKNWLV